jgi:hypothetical protein
MHPPAIDARIAVVPQIDEDTWDLYVDRQLHSTGYPDADTARATGLQLLGSNAEHLDFPTATDTVLPELEDDDDSPNPLTPYSGAPDVAIAVTLDALACAHDFFVSYYADEPKVVQGAGKALKALRERAWSIQADGSLEIAGSRGDTYLANDQGCVIEGSFRVNKKTGKHSAVWCKSFVFGQKHHGGQCYHLIARELLRLAQHMQ